MKVTCIIHSLNGGGAERVMAGLASRLQSRGHAVTLLTLDDGTQDKYDVDPRVTRVMLNLMRPSHSMLDALRSNTRRIARLRKAIGQSSPDVVLSFCDATNVLTLMSMTGTSIPVVVAERSDPAKQKLGWPWNQLRPALYRRASRVTVLTETAADAVENWTGRRPVVIASAVDEAPVPTFSCDTKTTSMTLLGVGRLEHEKGFDRLIEVFARLAPRHPDWNLRIVGEGSQRKQLEEQTVALGVAHRATLSPWQRPIWPAYQTADLFALPSRYEGFPSALLEAMATGLPVVSVDCESGPRAIIRDDFDGLLVANDDRSLEETISKCMSDDALRHRLGLEARSVIERFGWEAMVGAYEAVLVQSMAH